jgi:4-hydroxy-3-polyprenylbenzoate decarboxylase
MEDAYIGEAIIKFTLPIMKKQFPEIVDVNFPPWGVFHNLMLISIKKAYPGHARKVMHGIWGLGQAMFTKTIIVVDHDVDVHDYKEVCFRAAASIDPVRDFEIVKGPLDQLDHAGLYSCYGGKVGIDATTKWPDEGLNRPWPPIIESDAAAEKKVDALWRTLGLA